MVYNLQLNTRDKYIHTYIHTYIHSTDSVSASIAPEYGTCRYCLHYLRNEQMAHSKQMCLIFWQNFIFATTYIHYFTYRVSHELRSLLRESVPYVKLYRYNPKHLYPKLNGYGDNDHRNVWASGVSTYCSLCEAIHVHCACPTTRHGNAVTLASALQRVCELWSANMPFVFSHVE